MADSVIELNEEKPSAPSAVEVEAEIEAEERKEREERKRNREPPICFKDVVDVSWKKD